MTNKSTNNPNATFWQATPIEELTREELIEALEYAAKEIARLQRLSSKYLEHVDVMALLKTDR